MIGIAHDSVKVDHFVERFAGPDAMIDGLPQMLFYVGMVANNRGSFCRHDGTTNDWDAAGMRTSNHLLVAACDLFNCWCIGLRSQRSIAKHSSRKTDVVDSLEHYKIGDSGYRYCVPIKAR